MKKLCNLVLGLMVLSGLTISGCSNESADTADTDVYSNVDDADNMESIVASVDVGYGTIRFHELTNVDGLTSIVVSEEMPNTYLSSPLDSVLQDGHTNLEIFKALSPAAAVPAELIDAHSAETTRLNREDDGVIVPELDLDAPVQKSISACASYVWQDVPDDACYQIYWGNGRQAHNLSGNKSLHVGQYWAFATTSKVTLGICNDSNVNIQGRIGMDKGADNSSSYSYWGWATVKPGWMWRWWNFSRTNNNCSSGFCFPAPTRYRVDGRSASGKIYHLKTAELQHRIKSACRP